MILYSFLLLLLTIYVSSAPLQEEINVDLNQTVPAKVTKIEKFFEKHGYIKKARVPYVKLDDQFAEITRNWTKEAKKEMNDLLGMRNLSSYEVDMKKKEIVKKYCSYEQWIRYVQKSEWKKSRINNVVMLMSFNLPMVHEQVHGILLNQTLTPLETFVEMTRLGRKYPKEVIAISFLENLFDDYEEEIMSGTIDSVFSFNGKNSVSENWPAGAKEELRELILNSNVGMSDKKKKMKEWREKDEELLRNAVPYVTVDEEFRNLLKTWTPEAKEEFIGIEQISSLTHAEIYKKYEEWAEKYGYSEKWAAYNARWNARRFKKFEKMGAVFGNLRAVSDSYDRAQTRSTQEAEKVTGELISDYNWEMAVILFLYSEFEAHEEDIMTEDLKILFENINQDSKDPMRNIRDWRGVLMTRLIE